MAMAGFGRRASLAAVFAVLLAAPGLAQVKETPFGHMKDGRAVALYTLTNGNGLQAAITTYGARLVSLTVPDRNGKMGDIVLGYDRLAPYLKGRPYFGATIGRYANRIAKGRFTLDGVTYHLPINSGGNTLHGGGKGFDTRLWHAAPFETSDGPGLKLTYVSADGQEGFPGRLTVTVRYRLRNDNALQIDYRATTTKPTVVSLTNHSYFNLSADPMHHSILNELLTVNASRFTPLDKAHIPTGAISSVAGTPFDFRKATAIGARINADNEQIRIAHGYDDNWVLNKPKPGALTTAAVLTDPRNGRQLEVRTTEPGLQIYTGNFLGGGFPVHSGVALETQHFPDSPNHPSFPSTVLRPGQIYTSRTVYLFRTVK